MYKMCEKCGYFYDDSEYSQCPQCGDRNNFEKPSTKQAIDISEFNNTESTEKNVSAENNSSFKYIPSSEGTSTNNPTDAASEKRKKIKAHKTNSNSNNLGNHKMIAVITAGIIFIFLAVSAIVVTKSNKTIKINLTEYINSNVYYAENYNSTSYDVYNKSESYYSNYDSNASLYIYGYNDYGYLNKYDLKNTINWVALQNDINKQLSHKKKHNKRYLTFNDFFDINSFEFSADKVDQISNGDTIYVTVRTKGSYTFNKITIKIANCTYSYNITGLKTVQSFNPFNYVTFVGHNANGYASASCKVNENLNEDIEGLDGFKATYYDTTTIAIEKDDYIIAKIHYYFDSDTNSHSNYKNGDTVTMYCSCSNDDLTEDYNIYIGTYQKDYTFKDLGEYATKSSVISQEDLNKFISYANEKINKGSNGSSYTDFKFNSAYMADLRDQSKNSLYHNSLCLIYSYSYELWNGDKKTKYLYVRFNNLIVSDTGTIEFDPENYFNSMYYGYDSVDDVLSNKFGSDYNTVKL